MAACHPNCQGLLVATNRWGDDRCEIKAMIAFRFGLNRTGFRGVPRWPVYRRCTAVPVWGAAYRNGSVHEGPG